MQFSRQGNFRFDRFDGFEAWAGQRFDRARWRMFGGVQLYRWLNVDGQFFFGDAVFYDPVDPYQGRSREGSLGVTLQPSGRLSQAFNYRRISFDRASTGEHVYDLDLIYSRTTYQFSRQFFVRGIVQFDSSRWRVLTDFLSSYELRPGTVVYAGYGSLIERRGFRRRTVDPRRGRLCHEPARAVLQGVVPASVLAHVAFSIRQDITRCRIREASMT